MKNLVLKNVSLVFKKHIIKAKKLYLICIFLVISFTSIGQEEKYHINGELGFTGVLSTNNSIPFWFYTNTSTRVGELTNGLLYGKIEGDYQWGKNNQISVGVSLMFRDGVETNFQREIFFIAYTNNWLQATLGAKERPVFFNNLSSTNGDLLWSNNARPMPGLILEANDPIKISKTFQIDWGIAHYNLNDERYVKNTRVHYKRLGLIVNINDKNKITGTFKHFAQWAGTSPDFGDLPSNFEAFVKVFFARSGDEESPDGENINTVGNHIGAHLLKYELKSKIGGFSAYYEHLFEDGTGSRFVNFPDGIWGITYAPENNKIISGLLYEFTYTKNQSGDVDFSGRDNYFNNGIYRSGWTYDGNIIGTPLFTSDKTDNLPIISNRIIAHHLGVFRIINKIELIVKITYIESLGTFSNRYDSPHKSFRSFLSVKYTIGNIGTFTGLAGADFSNVTDTIFGAGLSYSYTF